jgi:hypothetical protein
MYANYDAALISLDLILHICVLWLVLSAVYILARNARELLRRVFDEINEESMSIACIGATVLSTGFFLYVTADRLPLYAREPVIGTVRAIERLFFRSSTLADTLEIPYSQ